MNAERMEVSYGAALTRGRVLRRVTRVGGIFSKPLKAELFSNETQRPPQRPLFQVAICPEHASSLWGS